MSAVVRMQPLETVAVADHGMLSKVVSIAFNQRRKTLRNSLKSIATEDDLDAVQIDPGLRAEAVAIPDWIALANRLAIITDSADNGD